MHTRNSGRTSPLVYEPEIERVARRNLASRLEATLASNQTNQTPPLTPTIETDSMANQNSNQTRININTEAISIPPKMFNLYLKSNRVVTSTLDHPLHLSETKIPITPNEHPNNKPFTDKRRYLSTLMIEMSIPTAEATEIVAIPRTKTHFST